MKRECSSVVVNLELGECWEVIVPSILFPHFPAPLPLARASHLVTFPPLLSLPLSSPFSLPLEVGPLKSI